MDFRVGNDIVYIPRLKEALTDRFKEFVYTPLELEQIENRAKPLERYASTIAAKEAIYKALKAFYPDKKIGWKDIEISRHGQGKPPRVSLNALEIDVEISLSLSHEEEYAYATVLIQKKS